MTDPERELAIEEYRALIHLATYEGTEFWSRFNYLFTINGAILSAIALTLGLSTTSLGHVAVGIIALSSLVGFLTSAVWLFVSFRSNAIQSIWHRRLKEIEVSGALRSSPNLKAILNMEHEFDEMKFRYVYRRVPLSSAAYLVPIFMMVAYASIQQLVLGQTPSVLLTTVDFAWLAEIAILADFLAWGLFERKKYQYLKKYGKSIDILSRGFWQGRDPNTTQGETP